MEFELGVDAVSAGDRLMSSISAVLNRQSAWVPSFLTSVSSELPLQVGARSHARQSGLDHRNPRR